MLSSRPSQRKPCKGEVELGVLGQAKYRVVDYENNRELGQVDSQNPGSR
jgi:hypothetical protein